MGLNVNFRPFWNVTVVIATDETLYLLTIFDAPERYSTYNFSFIFLRNICFHISRNSRELHVYLNSLFACLTKYVLLFLFISCQNFCQHLLLAYFALLTAGKIRHMFRVDHENSNPKGCYWKSGRRPTLIMAG